MESEMNFNLVIRQLVQNLRTRTFVLNYCLRNPTQGRGQGLMGVDGEELIRSYAEALERTCAFLTARGWALPPQVVSGDPVPVYVCDTTLLLEGGSPFTYTRNGLSRVFLRSDNGEPTREALRQRAAVEATHEAAHVLTHFLLPRRTSRLEMPDPWGWFDEAFAVFLEGQIFPEYAENLRYALHWVRSPEWSLERDALAFPPGYPGGWPGGYFAAWFLEYLVGRYPGFGWDLLRDTWRNATETERPVRVLARLLSQSRVMFADPDPAVPDLFGAQYCIDTYFVQRVFPRVFARFGERSLTARLMVQPGQTVGDGPDALEHLACRYYRLDPAERTTRVQLTL